MKTLNILWNTIDFNFNAPIEETWYICEDFNLHKNIAYATSWIKELLKFNNTFALQLIIWQIFQEYYNQAKVKKLDYLQTLSINWIEVWLICNSWDNSTNEKWTICLLTKDEY